MRFLLTNDDGIYAQGLASIKQALEEIGEVLVIAPVTEQSAVGHAITISDPLKVIPIHRSGQFYGYGITGSPADCVKLGVSCIMEQPPDVVVSGINRGENVGINVLYSGTVSAATEALILGYTGIALSVDNYLNPDYRAASVFGARLASTLAAKPLPSPVALNVNCPSCPISEVKGVRITRQGDSRIVDDFVRRESPRGTIYYWQAGLTRIMDDGEDTDAVCLRNRMVSITPINYRLGRDAQDGQLRSLDLEGMLRGI
ncbi:MAG TPA: 5'/3'-nucleotidase SurE [Deltaproteobacteria bacterium]|jgi:5'-nucleotidase|nr:5'/3'-nucleotidase SurE [Deltaproteobacteria bacterium]HOI08296.1 5'/3'-nucleotidase SurE [Deltaproteobacteria bacterium]